MPGPPEDVSPSDLFLKLQEAPRPTELVDFPRRTPDGKPIGKTRIQVLRSEDHDVARLRAKAAVKARHKLTDADLQDEAGAAVLRDAAAREILAMACCVEKNLGSEDKPYYPLAFPDADGIGKFVSADELAVLFEAYRLVQAKYGPFEKTVQTEEELSAWIKRLVEGAAEFPLQQLSSVHWAELAFLLAVRAYTLSRILESLHSSLPPTLQSRLGTYSLGTGFFGAPVAATSPDGTATSPSDTRLKIHDVTITTEDARDMAAKIKAVEENALAALDEAELTRE